MTGAHADHKDGERGDWSEHTGTPKTMSSTEALSKRRGQSTALARPRSLLRVRVQSDAIAVAVELMGPQVGGVLRSAAFGGWSAVRRGKESYAAGA